MNKKFLLFAALALAGLTGSPALAATGNIPFNATLAGTCILNAGSPGVLEIDPTNFQNLTSLANPGTMSVLATSNSFNISMDTPTLLRPVTDTQPLSSIGGAYHATGATTVNKFNTDAPYPLNQGTTNLNVYFFAGKNGTNLFAAGVYTATVTIRCE